VAGTDDWLSQVSLAGSGRPRAGLGELRKTYRATESLTQGELAAMLGVDQSYGSQIERAKRPVRNVDLLLRISEVLGIPRGQLGLANDASSSWLPSEPVRIDDIGLTLMTFGLANYSISSISSRRLVMSRRWRSFGVRLAVRLARLSRGTICRSEH
jgi:transcriptional regulator with XRE-family HTH domain